QTSIGGTIDLSVKVYIEHRAAGQENGRVNGHGHRYRLRTCITHVIGHRGQAMLSLTDGDRRAHITVGTAIGCGQRAAELDDVLQSYRSTDSGTADYRGSETGAHIGAVSGVAGDSDIRPDLHSIEQHLNTRRFGSFL